MHSEIMYLDVGKIITFFSLLALHSQYSKENANESISTHAFVYEVPHAFKTTALHD